MLMNTADKMNELAKSRPQREQQWLKERNKETLANILKEIKQAASAGKFSLCTTTGFPAWYEDDQMELLKAQNNLDWIRGQLVKQGFKVTRMQPVNPKDNRSQVGFEISWEHATTGAEDVKIFKDFGIHMFKLCLFSASAGILIAELCKALGL